MIRQIIKIDANKCDGCGLCVKSCHEGAIALVDNKAKLMREDYCDGLGDCLPACPTGAITFEEREADIYNPLAVAQNKKITTTAKEKHTLPCGCPSTEAKVFNRTNVAVNKPSNEGIQSELRQFPIQIQLVSSNAKYFDNADVLIAADCTAFAYGDFHRKFIKGKITLIGCPKLDNVDYTAKLTDILISNEVKSLTIVRMEVPCCGGIVESVKNALIASKKMIPWTIITVSRNGEIVK